MLNTILVIPARYKSSRLPGKPMINLAGKTMIMRTFERCAKVFPRDRIYIATEDIRIFEHCKAHGANVLMTSDNCLTGTDRVAEVAQIIHADHYINVQGDEPLFNPDDILKVLNLIQDNQEAIINGYCPISEEADFRSHSIPKVVFDKTGRLLYMSRSPIPNNKENKFVSANRQVCIYAFPKNVLIEFSKRSAKTTLEEIEDIEILSFLEMGKEVMMVELSTSSLAIDTPEDVEKVLLILKNEEASRV